MAEELDDDVVLLPSVALDPVFVDAVEDALSGPEVASAATVDPNRALGADPHDFAGLYIRHRSSFAAHARRFLRDPRDVDEVVQEAFLRLFLALPELGTELQALAYCRRTVTNLCIDRYRADKRRPRLVNIEAVPANDFADEELDDPVVQAEDAAFVREALALLTPLHREALVKREIEEKSLPVIAEELGIPEESVKHLLHRARRALRRHLAKTHLAPGADLESTSTLLLLAKSAAAGGGRLGVVALFTLAVLIGARPELPATALTSWPLGDIVTEVTHALTPEPPAKKVVTSPEPTTDSVLPAPAPQVPTTATSPREENVAIVVAPTVTPAASPVAAVVTSAAPSPATDPSAAPRSSASPTPAGSPEPSPTASPTTPSDPNGKPSANPSSSPSSPSKARSEVSPSPSSDTSTSDPSTEAPAAPTNEVAP